MSQLDQTPERALAAIAATPAVMRALLEGLDEETLTANEGPGSWSPLDVVGHLVHCEEEDWVPRFRHMAAHGDSVPFPPFDPEGHRDLCAGLDLAQRLERFEAKRSENLAWLRSQPLDAAQLDSTGQHPTFGTIRFHQMLATWACHDRVHVAQACRVLCRQAKDAVGPWREFLPILG